MKKVCCLLLMAWVLVACGGGSSDTQSTGGSSSSVALQQDEAVTGEIAQVGEVDWYEFDAVEANRTLTVSCSSTYTDSPVDFMLTVYEKDANGNLITVFGKSAPEDAYAAADLQIQVGIQQPRHLYFAVRDFRDDESSNQVKYRIKVSYSDETTQNSSFADAIVVEAGAGQVCHTGETIFPIGDVDCYRFNIPAAGVYRIAAQFNVSQSMTMPVNLGLELYDEFGQIVYSFKGQRPADNLYVILARLDSGAYYLVVDDQGRDDQSQYDYSVCIEPVAADEVLGNDTQAGAESRTEGVDGYELDGSLEYVQDEDWYVIPIPAASGAISQNLRISLHTAFSALPEALQGQTDPGSYRIEIRDADDTLLHAYDHPVAATAAYNVEIASGQGQQHYIMVKPLCSQQMVMALPYQLRVQLTEVSDPGEQNDPRTLDPNGETVTGKIYKLGDKDEYSITVDTTAGPRVLELHFNTAQASEVAYNLHVMYGGKHYILKDINGTENGAQFKASYYLPQTAGTGTAVQLQVCDDQNNDGADVTYTLTADVLNIPASVAATAAESAKAGSAAYFDEIGERADTGATDVTVIEYDNYNQPKFKANTTLLRVDALDANNQWRSDWIKGFSDYDGDRDIFELNFDAITASQDIWYLDIQVRMFAMASDVEYSWALFRDRPPVNNVLLERTFWEDTDGQVLQYDDDAEGVVAFWGDADLAASDYDETIPAGTDRFWLGHVWSGSKYYLSVQDFNKVLLDRIWNDSLERYDPVPNQTPDNDWGNTNSTPAVRPYYLQVTVTYHPGCSHPDDTSVQCTQ
jgi:hypothetical protein